MKSAKPARSGTQHGASRLADLAPAKTARRRGGPDAARDLQGAGGVPPEVSMPLELVQIDPTPVDLIIVDERDRQPIGTPF